MLHGSSRSKVRTIERRNIQSFPGKGGGCNSCACFTFTWIPGQPRTHQVEISYLIAKTCFKMFVSVLGGEKKLGVGGAGGTQNANANNLDMGMEELKFTAVAPT